MIFKLYKDGYFSYKKFILNNITKLELSPNEALVLIKLLDLYLTNERTLRVESISEATNIHGNDVDNILNNLLQLDYFSMYVENIDGVMTEKFTVEPFFKRVESLYLDDNNNSKEIDKIFALIERKTRKMLTNNDYNFINSLIEDGNTLDDITNAITTLEKGRYDITLKNIARQLEHNDAKSKTDPRLDDFFKKIGIR